MIDKNDKIVVKGKIVDDHTRCVHYHSPLDVIAIKFNCCNQYYPCYYCHLEEANHPATIWEKTAFSTRAIFCGICQNELTIEAYKACGYHCPFCNTPFNPRCVNHDHFYFEE